MVSVALAGGGYAVTVRGAVGTAIWCVLALGVGFGVWPRSGAPRAALVAGALLAGFAALNALSMVWADSPENAFGESDRASLYLAVFAVVVLVSTRARAWDWSTGLGGGIATVGVLALSSRLLPGLFGPSAVEKLQPNNPVLSYPVNYWNGLAAMVALAFPLLLAAAVRARRGVGAAFAVASIPALAGTIYLTSSRGGVLVAALGTVAFLVLASRRPVALAAVAIAAAGSALTIAVLHARDALVNGPVRSQVAETQGRTAAILIALICAATALAFPLVRRALPDRVLLPVLLKRAALALGVVLVVAGVAAAHPSDRFERFKQPPTSFVGSPEAPRSFGHAPRTVGKSYTASHLTGTGGSGRWQFWEVSVDQFQSRPLVGAGAGSFEAWWAHRGTLNYFTRNPHSLYFEVLGGLGAVGLALLLATFGAGISAAVTRFRAVRREDRLLLAGVTAAFLAYLLAAGIDWIWELPAVGAIGFVCLGLLVGPATLPAGREGPTPRLRLGPRAAVALVALLAALGQAIPYVTQLEIRASQRALTRGELSSALSHARRARSLQGWAASPDLQLSLVQERRGKLASARKSIDRAIAHDASDWRLWAVASRIERESGLAAAARRSYERALALNPRSPALRRAP